MTPVFEYTALSSQQIVRLTTYHPSQSTICNENRQYTSFYGRRDSVKLFTIIDGGEEETDVQEERRVSKNHSMSGLT